MLNIGHITFACFLPCIVLQLISVTRAGLSNSEYRSGKQSWSPEFGRSYGNLSPGKAHNNATPAPCNRPKPERELPLSAIGLHILQRLQCEGRRINLP